MRWMVSRWMAFRWSPWAALLAAVLAIGAAGPAAAMTMVDFNGDSVGLIDGNDFTSAGVPEIHFIDTVDLFQFEMFIANEPFTNSSNALGVPYDDGSALRIALDFSANSIAMDFFVGDSYVPQAGDMAVLTAFMSGNPSPVGQVSQALDQPSISFDGTPFDSVELEFVNASSGGLTEFVDNVSVTPIPEPGAAVVFGAGALLVAAACGRRAGAAEGARGRRR